MTTEYRRLMAEWSVQRGGCSDLDVLWDELANWSGYYVENICPSASYGSHDRDGNREPDRQGSYHERFTNSWCVEVEENGWDGERDRWLMWGDSIGNAAAKLAEHMRERRLNPHLLHIEDSEFVRNCSDCERDANDYPWNGDVDWSD